MPRGAYCQSLKLGCSSNAAQEQLLLPPQRQLLDGWLAATARLSLHRRKLPDSIALLDSAASTLTAVFMHCRCYWAATWQEKFRYHAAGTQTKSIFRCEAFAAGTAASLSTWGEGRAQGKAQQKLHRYSVQVNTIPIPIPTHKSMRK